MYVKTVSLSKDTVFSLDLPACSCKHVYDVHTKHGEQLLVDIGTHLRPAQLLYSSSQTIPNTSAASQSGKLGA